MKTESLLISLFVCHFLADFTHLSTGWMLAAKRLGKPLWPIMAHALVHGVLMAIVVYGFTENIYLTLLLGTFQAASHFCIDVLKGRMNGWFPSLQNPANKWHWVVFGADQLLHAIVIILMVSLV